MRGNIIKKYLHVKRLPRMSLDCKLVQYREYEYCLLLLLLFLVSQLHAVDGTFLQDETSGSCIRPAESGQASRKKSRETASAKYNERDN